MLTEIVQCDVCGCVVFRRSVTREGSAVLEERPRITTRWRGGAVETALTLCAKAGCREKGDVAGNALTEEFLKPSKENGSSKPAGGSKTMGDV